MQLTQIFDRRLAVGLLLVLGALLALSPAGLRQAEQLSAQDISHMVTGKSDHVTAEEVSAWIIDKQPDLLIVDLRSSEEYQQYHLPGAVNIPLTRLFEPESLDQLSDLYTIVLYSNGGTHAAQAWVLLQQMGIKSYVMLGGLNYWVDAILNPQPPGDLAADSEILQYQFRKGASGFFNGGGVSVEQENQPAQSDATRPKLPPRRKKKGEEGC